MLDTTLIRSILKLEEHERISSIYPWPVNTENLVLVIIDTPEDVFDDPFYVVDISNKVYRGVNPGKFPEEFKLATSKKPLYTMKKEIKHSCCGHKTKNVKKKKPKRTLTLAKRLNKEKTNEQ